MLYPNLSIRSAQTDSTFYSKELIATCEARGAGFSIMSDKTNPFLVRLHRHRPLAARGRLL